MSATFDLRGVTRVAPALSPARLCLLFSTVPGLRSGPGTTPEGALFLWLADLLARHSPLPPEHQALVLVKLGAGVCAAGRRIWEVLAAYESGQRPPQVPTAHLTVWDRRYVSLTGHAATLDLRAARDVEDMPRAPLLVESYNLTTLFTRNRAKMVRDARRAQEGSDAGRDSPPH
jgi:hypothetical protein